MERSAVSQLVEAVEEEEREDARGELKEHARRSAK